jgi:uncharacterized RDD family membrane protein YckC
LIADAVMAAPATIDRQSSASPDDSLPLTIAAAAGTAAPADLPLRAVEPRTPTLFADTPPPARTPLAVRRVTGERPRSRTPAPAPRPRPMLVERLPDPALEAPAAAAASIEPVVASMLRRGGARLLDLLILGVIDAAIVYLTVQIAGLSMANVLALPPVPLAAFIGGLNLAYFVVFTAFGGQTLGQMAAGVRVEGHDGRLSIGAAVLRVIAGAAGGLVLGAGWWPAALRADGQAVHDRLTRTRVVRVGAR